MHNCNCKYHILKSVYSNYRVIIVCTIYRCINDRTNFCLLKNDLNPSSSSCIYRQFFRDILPTNDRSVRNQLPIENIFTKLSQWSDWTSRFGVKGALKSLFFRKGGRISLRIFIRLAGFHFREIGILNCILSLRDAEYRTTYLTVLNIPVSRASWLISWSFQIRTVKFASAPPAS